MENRDSCPKCKADLRPQGVSPTFSVQNKLPSTTKSWLSRLTSKNISQLTTAETTNPEPPAITNPGQNKELEKLIKEAAPALKSVETPPAKGQRSITNTQWEDFTDLDLQEDTDHTFDVIEEVKSIELNLWDEAPSPQQPSIPKQATVEPAAKIGISSKNEVEDAPTETLTLAPEEPETIQTMAASDEGEETDNDLEALLSSFDPPVNNEVSPINGENEIEASDEEISSFLASFEDHESPEAEPDSKQSDPQIRPTIVEFDDDNLEQQIDDMLDDMVLDVTAIKTSTNLSTVKPPTTGIIVDDDIEIEFEFDAADEERSQQKQNIQPETADKDSTKLKRYGGLLSEFDSIEEETKVIPLTKKDESSETDLLLNLIEQVGNPSGESIEQRLAHILAASGNSPHVRELCSLVAHAYDINPQFLIKSSTENKNPIAAENDPLNPLKNELNHEIDLLISTGSSISTVTNKQVDFLESPPDTNSNLSDSKANNEPYDDIEQLIKELDDDATEFEIDIESDQKKKDEVVVAPNRENNQPLDIPEPDPLSNNSFNIDLWTILEDEIVKLEQTTNLDIEIDINEVIKFKPNDKTTLLFDILEEELINPAKVSKKPASIPAAQPSSHIENTSLIDAFKQYEEEVKTIEKLKAEGKYIDHRKRMVTLTYRTPPLWRRLCAWSIDLGTYLILSLVVTIIFLVPREVKKELLNTNGIAPEYFVPYLSVVLATIFLSWLLVGSTLVISQRKSFGQKLMKLELQNPEDLEIGFSQAFIYSTTHIFSSLFFLPAYLGAFRKNHKTLADHLSGLVVSVSTPKKVPPKKVLRERVK